MSEGINVPRNVAVPLNLNLTWQEKLRALSKFLGPAFIVSVAYIDPGNFATNISAGSNFNYGLVWVVLWSNLMAIFLQTLSAKLGIVTGEDLATHCGKVFSRKTNILLWTTMLFAAIATYMAEFLGATLGLYLLFGIPLVTAGCITVALTFGIVFLRRYGQHVVERVIIGLVAVIGISYLAEIFLAKPDWGAVVFHTLVPNLGPESILVAVGMLGATVMPHVIYLHSDLMKARRKSDSIEEAKSHFKMERFDIIFAMNIAFLVNAAMVVVAAAVFYGQGSPVDSIEQAHQSLAPLLGSFSAGAFGLALLASGLSSSTVGAMAGECMLKGFIGLDIPISVRRIITIIPAIVLLWLGFNPMKILIMSQVTLSFALPAAIIPLMLITKRKEIMGAFVNKSITNWIGVVIVTMIVSLNAVLLYLSFAG
ncbi:MAG: Nramp family divalent metal transporter [Peptococcaceae bacterium]|nr:Nramp family divalent metal transporter [Peptococcaceae bacterium]